MTQLPTFLQRTPEQMAAEQERQKVLRDLHLKGATQTPAEQKLAHAMLREKAIRANLEQITDANLRRDTELELADSLAEQGRFREAATIDPQFQEMVEAVDRDDDDFCHCPEDSVQSRNAQGAVTIPIPKHFVVGEVFSEKAGKIVPLVKCAKCGTLNATESRDPTHGLAAIEKDRNEAFAK